MNIAQLSEQLKDVPQNRLIDYARNPNSVVPQFLALAEIQRRQQLQAQAQPPQSTVANDVLSQAQPAPQVAQMAQQLPENQPGVAQLPSQVAAQGFAPGGLVAFADGGLSMDDDDEDREMAQLFPTNRLAGITEVLASLPANMRSLASKLPKSYEETKKEYASQDGIDALLSKVRQIESGNRHVDAKGNIITSPKGAEGIMQVMRHTQRDPGFGVTPAKDKSPAELQRVGEDYFKAMLNKYQDAKLAAMAYNWGPGNVDKWLASDRKTPVPKETVRYASNFAKGGIASYAGLEGSLVGPEGEPISDFLERNPVEPTPEKKLSRLEAVRAKEAADAERVLAENRAKAAAMRGTPSATPAAAAPSAASSGITRLNKLIGSYLAPAAVYEGGKYATTGGLSTIAPQAYSATRDILTGAGGGDDTALASAILNAADYTKPESSWSQALRNIFSSGAPAEKAPVAAPAPAPAAPQKSIQVTTPPVVEYKGETLKSPAAAPEVTKTKADLYAEALEKDIEAQAAKAAKSGDMNLALSILQAGLGMMGSRSPYFMQGLGEGAQQGVSTFAALQKQQADREKEILGARLGLYKYGAAAESAAETREYNKLIKEAALGQKEAESATRKEDRALDRIRLFDSNIDKNIRTEVMANPTLAMRPDVEQIINQRIAAAKANNPIYKKFYADAGLGEYTAPSVGPVIVQTPKGPVSFPSQEAADEFKRKAGIK